jgi:predicted PurR-regulated permease PerM
VAWWLLWWVAGIFLAMPIVGIIQKFLENNKHPLYEVLN